MARTIKLDSKGRGAAFSDKDWTYVQDGATKRKITNAEFLRQILEHHRRTAETELGLQHPLGIADIKYPANDRDSSIFLREAERVDLVFNDMKSWLPGPLASGKHLKAIQDRLRNKRLTRIWLLHPESKMIPEVSRASGKDPQAQIDEIELAVMRICENLWHLALPKKKMNFEERPLQIVGHPRYNTYSMMKFDDVAWVNYYPITSRGSGDLGHFHIYVPTPSELSVFKRIENDLSNTTAKAREVFPHTFDLVAYYFKKNVLVGKSQQRKRGS